MLPSKDQGDVQRAEHERALPAGANTRLVRSFFGFRGKNHLFWWQQSFLTSLKVTSFLNTAAGACAHHRVCSYHSYEQVKYFTSHHARRSRRARQGGTKANTTVTSLAKRLTCGTPACATDHTSLRKALEVSRQVCTRRKYPCVRPTKPRSKTVSFCGSSRSALKAAFELNETECREKPTPPHLSRYHGTQITLSTDTELVLPVRAATGQVRHFW